jgi:predicted ATPase
LQLNAKRTVTTIVPPFAEATVDSAKAVQRPFTTAVQEWLAYLGVAEELQIIERGKLGHELRVKALGSNEFQDLTNVGVGVSQVLPIVVSCILAEPGSTLIFEQPELHLHPAVQGRLTDLFISMIALDKQIILETHSEHIIERLRLRVVEDFSDKLHSATSLFYFEIENGRTVVRPVKITTFGAIPDWPRGFFDQSQIASEQIVLKAIDRRRTQINRAAPAQEFEP